MSVDTTIETTTKHSNSRRFVFIAVLVSALIALIMAVTNMKQKEKELANTRQSLEQQLAQVSQLDAQNRSKSESIDTLMRVAQSLEEENKELVKLNKTIPQLKHDLSKYRAEFQRSDLLKSAHQNLMNTVADQQVSIEELNAQVGSIPPLKKALSHERAENQRSQLVKTARENLKKKLSSQTVEMEKLQTQVDTIPTLKHTLSHATAQNQRSRFVTIARDNLRRKVKEQSEEIDVLSNQVTQIPSLKKELSFARAESQRAEWTAKARATLVKERKLLIAEKSQLVAQTEKIPALRAKLSYLEAESVRLKHIAQARDNLMLKTKNLEQKITDIQEQNERIPELEKQLGEVLEENERLKTIELASTQFINTLGVSDQTQLDEKKKELSIARAELKRLESVKNARDQLMAELKQIRAQANELETKDAAEQDTKETQVKAEVLAVTPANTDTKRSDESDIKTSNTVDPSTLIAQRKIDELATELRETVVFVSGSAWVNFKARKSLNKLVSVMNDHPETQIEIGGHTDNLGAENVNIQLSQRRATQVRAYLLSQGVKPNRLIAKGFGSSAPLLSNDTLQGRQRNRRVEFTVVN